MGFFSEFSKGVKGQEPGECYAVADIDVHCSHCGCDRFFERSALLDSRGMSFVGIDWASKNATVLVCAHCGHVEWFSEIGKVNRQ